MVILDHPVDIMPCAHLIGRKTMVKFDYPVDIMPCAYFRRDEKIFIHRSFRDAVPD